MISSPFPGRVTNYLTPQDIFYEAHCPGLEHPPSRGRGYQVGTGKALGRGPLYVNTLVRFGEEDSTPGS